jgi:protein-S-isoprenylcysteine O-methyltransferase Ste14
MLGRPEFLLSVLVPALLVGAISAIGKRRNARRLPSGSYVAEESSAGVVRKAPGSSWSRYGGLIGHWLSDFTLFAFVIVYLLYYLMPSIDLWKYISPYVVDLPVWVNWTGIAGLWVLQALNASVMWYNVNFTMCTKPMKGRYVLATGGPYRLVRHPTYLSESLATVVVLLATGVWLNLIGFVSWFALRSQAKAEEEALVRKFGDVYVQYAARTGRFFPRLRKQRPGP